MATTATSKPDNRHTLSVLVENKPGVLARVAGLFARRGFNIESLAVSETEDPDTSRMTIVVSGPPRTLEQISKQLYKLIDVIKVFDYTDAAVVERQLALIKVRCTKETRSEIIQITDIFRAQIVDMSPESITVEVTGNTRKIAAVRNLLEQFGILEMVGTGSVVLVRGLQLT
ncbi:MAG: acetolactate synthase small subunit [Armatimonadetes bacterium CG_4_10_14_3_um_filter_66_18]|nr:acetolactate synthase small subunit [Armatimonadota bacterium]OIP03515.1 MAG: acetolactate synthase small subunit [Armatimonadetes bacterium CG2_30_66_41]PIU95827.1 MAG: acetolactate synthase small subunit [Armatimonadetes bacterium CG06_land_8_20_14_3_00_66_21]PIW13479.1 MAG: acetolactate synthase small subunit [Armatimonadetes bacterium CG17_big_fil_post_rev_8_21_14_2_50_66_6]PIX49957.1 MAG: acetolactate synthase small subunit [Armatimonadetes bacterium CG_4_8_14_3_um_filter_66_20]PIY3926